MQAAALSETGNDRIRPGGNMSPFDLAVAEFMDLYDEAKNWADGSAIESQEQCDALDKLDKALLGAGQKLDALRVEEKRPLDEQVQAIQDRFNPFIQPKKGKADLARSSLNPIRAAWKEAERQRKEAIALKARLEADEERRKAEEAIRASAGNLEARERAEEQLALANDAEGFASRREKAATTGLGLRTYYRPDLTDLSAAIKHYWASHRGEFEALVCRLAAEDVRAGKRTLPGFTIHEERKAL
jgi:hypothetical protein